VEQERLIGREIEFSLEARNIGALAQQNAFAQRRIFSGGSKTLRAKVVGEPGTTQACEDSHRRVRILDAPNPYLEPIAAKVSGAKLVSVTNPPMDLGPRQMQRGDFPLDARRDAVKL